MALKSRVIADTRFLIVHTLPSTELEREKIDELMHLHLREGLLIPTVVVVEYLKVAGRKLGKQAAILRIQKLKNDGAEFISLDEKIAFTAGELLLKEPEKPIGDVIIAATSLNAKARFLISDDPEFEQLWVKTKWI